MRRRNSKFDVKKAIIWVVTMLLSITAILVGNRAVMGEAQIFTNSDSEVTRATVTQVLDQASDTLELGGNTSYENTVVAFKCEIKSGKDAGKEVEALQTIDGMYAGSQYVKAVEPGDKIILIRAEGATNMDGMWQFSDYYRFDKILILIGIFVVIILLIGRWKGVNTLLSLAFTFCFVFFVFVPAVMSGYNAYLWSCVTCVFTIVMTLILINSISKKTIATIIGCISGTVIAALGTAIMSEVLGLTGYVDEHSYYLTLLNTETPIDLTAIIFAAITIGAVGAIMDVAMDLSSSLYELSEQVPDMTFVKLCKSGFSIGRDIMGTMANTLVLAYIGSSLSCIMILLTYTASSLDLLSREVIVVELLQAVVGSLAILLTVPCTIVICGILYIGHNNKRRTK
ncbi:MAG: YibE/F family protein [Anaerovoracaceae bacterium]|nr:YibE/F family protein [Anaerovoracaceae bacterium]